MNPLYEHRTRPLRPFDELIKELIGDQTWKERAACRGLDVNIFYPDRGITPNTAKTICQSCEVCEQCAEFALTNNEQHGVWGGLALRDRRKAARQTTITEEETDDRHREPIY